MAIKMLKIKRSEIGVIRLLVLVFLLNCCGNQKTEETTKNRQLNIDEPTRSTELINKVELREMSQKILFQGDTTSYKKIASFYFSNERNYEFLYYALVMANKYDYNKAYFDVYIILSKPQTWNIISFDKLDKRTQKMALFYLLKSHEKGYAEAKYSITNIFGDTTPPKSSAFID